MTRRFMTRRLLPALLSTMLLGPLAAAAGAGAQELPASTTNDGRTANEAAPAAKSIDGRTSVTRSDGSTGFIRSPDPKEIRKLVGYMRDGMARADRSETQRQSKRTIQNRHDNRSRK